MRCREQQKDHSIPHTVHQSDFLSGFSLSNNSHHENIFFFCDPQGQKKGTNSTTVAMSTLFTSVHRSGLYSTACPPLGGTLVLTLLYSAAGFTAKSLRFAPCSHAKKIVACADKPSLASQPLPTRRKGLVNFAS